MENRGGDAIKEWRALRQQSQHTLAVAIGKTAPAISQFETGKTTPSVDTVANMDRELETGGALLDAFGYVEAVRPVTREEFNQLVAATEALGRAVLESQTLSKESQQVLAARLSELEAAPPMPSQTRIAQ